MQLLEKKRPAIADADMKLSVDVPGVGSLSDKDSQTHVGWTLGAGVEVGVTDNVSLKAEYLYVDLGKETYHLSDAGVDVDAKADLRTHIVRAGLNYRF